MWSLLCSQGVGLSATSIQKHNLGACSDLFLISKSKAQSLRLFGFVSVMKVKSSAQNATGKFAAKDYHSVLKVILLDIAAVHSAGGLDHTLSLSLYGTFFNVKVKFCGSHILYSVFCTMMLHTNADSKCASCSANCISIDSVCDCNRGSLRYSRSARYARQTYQKNGQWKPYAQVTYLKSESSLVNWYVI